MTNYEARQAEARSQPLRFWRSGSRGACTRARADMRVRDLRLSIAIRCDGLRRWARLARSALARYLRALGIRCGSSRVVAISITTTT